MRSARLRGLCGSEGNVSKALLDNGNALLRVRDHLRHQSLLHYGSIDCEKYFKKILKKLQKGVDKRKTMCYNIEADERKQQIWVWRSW